MHVCKFGKEIIVFYKFSLPISDTFHCVFPLFLIILLQKAVSGLFALYHIVEFFHNNSPDVDSRLYLTLLHAQNGLIMQNGDFLSLSQFVQSAYRLKIFGYGRGELVIVIQSILQRLQQDVKL